MKKPFNFMVDTIQPNSLSVAKVKQFDTALFNITITENGSAKDLTGANLRFFIRKADGKLVFQDEGITIVDERAGKITIDVRNSAFQYVGVAVAEIDITSNGQPIATADFYFDVSEKLGNDEAVKSVIDVDLFTQLSNYIEKALADIKKYKVLMEAFTKAGISLEGLSDIKKYIDDNLSGLKLQGDRATKLIPQLDTKNSTAERLIAGLGTATLSGEAKRVQLVNITNSAESKRIEVDHTITTADASKKALEGTTSSAEAKKKEVQSTTATAEAKRVQVVGATNSAESKRIEVVNATSSADAKKKEIESTTEIANASKKALEGTISTASENKKALDSSITLGRNSKSALETAKGNADASKKALEGTIASGNSVKTGLDNSIGTGNSVKGALEVATATAETKRIQVVDATGKAESKRADLQKILNSVAQSELITMTQFKNALSGKIDKTSIRLEGADFNIITEGGLYATVKNTVEKHAPTGSDGRLFVLPWNSGKWASQMFFADGGRIFTRTARNIQGTEWTGWTELYTRQSKPTPADIGAISKTGDTVTGTLKFSTGGNEIEMANPSQGLQARGIVFKDNFKNNNLIGMMGGYLNGQTLQKMFIGTTNNPWSGVKSFTVDSAGCYYDNQKIYHVGNKPSPSDIGAISEGDVSIEPVGNKTVQRDGAGDIKGRLLRTNYNDENYMKGALAFRVNNSSDNYTRYCNNPTAIRDWIGAVSKTGDTVLGDLSFSTGKNLITANCCGLKGKLSNGRDSDYLMYMGSDDRIKLSYHNRPIDIQTADVKIQGSKVLSDIQAEPLWKGYHHMSEKESITPSKALSKCNNGWVLVWSDWNDGGTGSDFNYCYTYIPKNTIAKKGQNHDFQIAVYEDSTLDSYAVKCLYIHDDHFTGCDKNLKGNSYDAVIRAVLEY